MAHMKQLCEHEGVLLEIEYSEPSHAEGVKIDSARVLDETYRATGPCSSAGWLMILQRNEE
jgi:hypothetical protein